jgi:hypothetical protein
VNAVLDDLAAFLRYMLAPAMSPSRADFGSRWTARSLTIQTGELQPARGLFWHPAPGTTTEEDVWVSYTRDRQPLTGIRNAFRTLAVG